MLVERALTASPSAPNLLKPHLYREAVQRVSAGNALKRTAASVVIPDYAVRMAILDFEAFPPGEEERAALLRFRLRKTVPFHIDEAQLAYSVQLNEPKRIEVLAVAIARPILDEYEGIFTQAGYRVGLVTPSSIAALRLCPGAENGLTLFAKAAGSTLSVLLVEQGRVRLVRCLDLAAGEGEELRAEEYTVLPLLQQTLAYAEDQIGQPVTAIAALRVRPRNGFVGKAGAKGVRGSLCSSSLQIRNTVPGECRASRAFGAVRRMSSFSPTAINLASQPFRRERAQNAAFALLCIALTCSLAVLISLIFHARAQAADLRRGINADTTELRRLQKEQAQFSRVLAKPENEDVFAKNVFLNELIARRAVSWTRVFKDLGTVMPSDMRLVGVRLPQVAAEDGSSTNRVQLDMEVGADRPDVIIELLKRLQTSQLFGAAKMVAQQPPTQNDRLYRYRVTVEYAQKL